MEPHLAAHPNAAVLDQAGQLDELVAASLREAVARTEDLGLRALHRAVQLQELAATLDPGPAAASLQALLDEQVRDLLRSGQYHDIFSQAVGRSLSIQDRRAALVRRLVAAMQDGAAPEPLVRDAAALVATCRSEQARHGGACGPATGSVELF